jgi:hypothetical protein
LLNVDSFETGASFPTTLDLWRPKNKSILAAIKWLWNSTPSIDKRVASMSVVASPLRTLGWIPTMRPSWCDMCFHLVCSFLFTRTPLKATTQMLPGRFGLTEAKKQSVCHMLLK